MTTHIPGRAIRLALTAVIVLTPHAVQSQNLESRIASAAGKSVAFHFATRPNVCGDGMSIQISEDTSEGWNTRSSRHGIHIGRSMSGYRGPCEIEPARAVVERNRDGVTRVQVSLGGRRTKADTELGDVSSAEAAGYLLSIAPRLDGRSADAAVLGAAIADSAVIWRRLLEIARDEKASGSARKTALFWVAQEATAAALAGLDSVASDEDADVGVRSDALFHLANRPSGEGVPALIRVVRTSEHRKLRKDAIWHLSQSGDPRAIELFEQLLTGK